jgi:hypothetical protein
LSLWSSQPPFWQLTYLLPYKNTDKRVTIPSFWVLIQGHPAASFRRLYNCRYKSVGMAPSSYENNASKNFFEINRLILTTFSYPNDLERILIV